MIYDTELIYIWLSNNLFLYYLVIYIFCCSGWIIASEPHLFCDCK